MSAPETAPTPLAAPPDDPAPHYQLPLDGLEGEPQEPASEAAPLGEPARAPIKVAPAALLFGLVFYYAYHFSVITVDMLRAFQQPAYDMAIPDQGIWLLSRFHVPFLTVAGRDLFGDHASFVYLSLVPVYWVYPHAAALLVVQASLQAAGAVPIFLLARHLLRNDWAALLLGATYLLNPALQETDLEQFHAEAFETFFLALAIYAAVVWKPRLLMVSLIMVLLCKEDAALYALPLAAWVFWRRDKTLGLTGAGLAVSAAMFDNLFLIPAIIGYSTAHGGRLPFGGLSGTLSTLVRRPGQFWAYITSNDRPWYVWQMTFSAGLVLLAAPELVMIGICQLGVNVISAFGYQHQVLYHYSMPIVPVLVCGSVLGVSRLKKAAARYIVTSLVVFSALWSCILWGAAPFSDNPAVAPSTNTPDLVATRALLKMVPPNAVVSADQSFVVDLDHRQQAYLWPNPFYQVYYGNPDNDTRSWPEAAKVQWLVLPLCITCDQGTAPWVPVEQRVIKQFRLVAQSPTYGLYERVRTGT